MEKKIELFGSYDQSLHIPLVNRVTYQLCDIKTVVEPQQNGIGRTRIAIPSAIYLRNAFIHQKSNGESFLVEYFVSNNVVRNRNGESVLLPKRGQIVLGRKEHGQKTLDPSKNPLDKILYTIMELHPDNVANGGKVFKKLDPDAVAKKEIEQDKLTYLAHKAIYDMLDSDVNNTCKGLLIEFELPYDMVTIDMKKHQLLKVAKKDPQDFLTTIRSFEFELRTVVKDAEMAELIKWNLAKEVWLYGKTDELLVAKIPALDKYETLVEWFKTSKKGENALERLKVELASLNKKEEVIKKPKSTEVV